MSRPTKKEIDLLKKQQDEMDSEAYHIEFDGLLEAKLMKLDPEWMKAMTKIYQNSGMSRWCA